MPKFSPIQDQKISQGQQGDRTSSNHTQVDFPLPHSGKSMPHTRSTSCSFLSLGFQTTFPLPHSGKNLSHRRSTSCSFPSSGFDFLLEMYLRREKTGVSSGLDFLLEMHLRRVHTSIKARKTSRRERTMTLEGSRKERTMILEQAFKII
jgi:hypothetical protein